MLLSLTSTLFFLISRLCEQNTINRLKTFSIPCNPSTVCSHIEVSTSINDIENGECDFNITLIAYNMDPDGHHGIAFTLAGPKKTIQFLCLKLDYGVSQAHVVTDKAWPKAGSSIYMNRDLICTWIVQPFTFKQSSYDIGVLQDSVYNGNYNLKLELDKVVSVVSQNSTQLPWYQLSFTRFGGYQIYGNDKYQLIIKRKKLSVQLWVNTFDETPKYIRITLAHEKSSYLIILCNYNANLVTGYNLNIDGSIGSLTDDQPKFNKIVGNLCSVELPDIFTCKKGYCSIWDSTFDLHIDNDKTQVYSLNNVKLAEPTSRPIPSCEDIVVLSSFIVTSSLIIIGLIYYIVCNLAKKWVSIDT